MQQDAATIDIPQVSMVPRVLLAVTPLILAVTAAAAIRALEARQELVEHTAEVIDTLASFERGVTRANILIRDAIVLSRPASSKDSDLALVFVNSSLERLGTLVKDNAAQTAVLNSLAPLSESFSDIVRAGPNGQATTTQIGRVSSLVDEILALSRRLDSEERRLLATRMIERDGVQRKLAMVFVAAVLLNVVSLAWGFVQQRRVQRVQSAARQHLQRRVEERTAELQKAVVQLQRTNADLERFAWSASHDLQEPLRNVGSYVTLLKRRYEGQLDSDADRYIRFAADGAKRMQDLISDLVTFAGLQKETFRWSMTPLEEPLQDSLSYLKTFIEETHASVTFDELPVVNIDGSQMKRVFRGLLSNSIKFAAPQRAPEVKVTATKMENEWHISLKDNGIGFEPEYAERIFDMFATLHARGKYPGTGTGLAIARRVIELHGGRIWAESQPKMGTTFHFTLPSASELQQVGRVTAD